MHCRRQKAIRRHQKNDDARASHSFYPGCTHGAVRFGLSATEFVALVEMLFLHFTNQPLRRVAGLSLQSSATTHAPAPSKELK